MAISRLTQTTLQNAFQKFNTVWDGRSAVGGMDALGVITVPSGGVSSITFSSIPATYAHLQIRYIGRDTNVISRSALYITFNSDTGANYAYHGLYGDGATAGSFASASSNYIYGPELAGAGATASIFGMGMTDILDYTNTNKYKTTRSITGEDNSGAGQVRFLSGLWMSLSAVTSITLTPSSPNLQQYSHFALYGIK